MSYIQRHIPIFIICVLYAVTLIGFIFQPAYFRTLSPINLCFSAGLVLLMSGQSKWQFYAALFAAAIFGFFVEVLGVKTGVIFGSYYYGKALGMKFFSVPLLMGVNWAILLYSTAQLSKFKNHIVNALFGSLLMVGLDFFMEKSASKLDFWYWHASKIPIQNYIAWFVISFMLNLLVQKHLAQKPNSTSKAFYIVQIAFFSILYFFVK